MAKKKSFSIGKSLSEALTDTVTAASSFRGQLHVEVIPLRKIELDPDNPRDLVLELNDIRNGIDPDDKNSKRKALELESLSSLSKSIVDQGIINPVIVYKCGENYRLIAGERRTLASALAQQNDIPAKILSEKPTPLKLSLLQWVENMERKDLSLWERMLNLEKILSAYSKSESKNLEVITSSEICQLVGCSAQQAINYKHVILAPAKLKSLIQSNSIASIEKASLIATAPKVIQEELIAECLKGATLSKLQQIVKAHKEAGQQHLSERGRGRQTTRVNFGSTKDINVAKIILQSLLGNNEIANHFKDANEIQWDDYKSVTESFKAIIKKLESTKI